MFQLTAVAGDGQVDLNWASVDKAKKFRVRRSGEVIATFYGTHLTDTDVTNGTTYSYLVTALDRRGQRIDMSSTEEATPKAPAPGSDLPALVGHGKAVTGGGDAVPAKVTTIAQFMEAVQDSGKRVVYGDHQWLMGTGQSIKAGSGDLTVIGISYGKLAVVYNEGNIRLHDVRSLPNGGQVSADADGLTVNGQSSSGPVEGFAASNSWFSGGPDMGGGALLGEVFDLTLQHCVFGPGLVASLGSDERDHNRILNFTTFGDHADGPWGKRQTTYECLVWGGEERNPDLKYVEANDFVRNLIYNFRGGTGSPGGNPRGCNFMYNRVRSGPETDPSKAKVWNGFVKPDETPFPNSVYTLGNVADGFTAKETFQPGTQRTSPFGTLSVQATAAPGVDEILALVGPTTGRNSQEQRLLDHVHNRTSDGYYYGPGAGTPNLGWPTNPTG